jgi:hypothetical protein
LERRHGAKVALVEAAKAPRLVALGQNYDRAVSEPQTEVRIPGIELGYRPVVTSLQAGDVVASRREITEEGTPSYFAEAGSEQVVDLARNRR